MWLITIMLFAAAAPVPTAKTAADAPTTGPTTQPTTAPATRPTTAPWAELTPPQRLREARIRSASAQDQALRAVRRANWYLRMALEVDRLARRLDALRARGTPKERVEASAAWNKARAELAARESEAVRRDPEVVASNRLLQTAEVEQRDYEQRQAQARAEEQARLAAAREAAEAERHEREQAAADAQGTSSGGGGVPVRGYYRKDGTYVQPHTRARPRK